MNLHRNISLQAINQGSWYAVSKAIGCGDASAGATKTLDCMRSKPYTEILDGMKKASIASMGAFFPTADDKIVFRDYPKRREAGNFIKVPYLVGNTDDEPGISYAIARPPPKAPTKGIVTKRQNKGMIQSKDGCGPDAAATARVKAGVPAWRYLSAMVFPNSDVGSPGCWHGGDIGYVFGTQEYLTRVPDTEDEKKFTSTIMNAWASFAKDPQNGLKKLGWPIYDGEKPTLIVLGGRNSSAIRFIDRKTVDVGC